MKTIEKKCLGCDTLFNADIREHNRGNANFCSLSCSSKRERKIKVANMSCAYCDIKFYRPKSKKNNSKSGLHFCCREHKDLAQKLGNGFEAIHPKHYGTATGLYTYRSKIFEVKEQKCEKCSYDEHIEILEVHHKDRNRKNNEIENLIILCPNCHMWEHYQNNDGRYKKKLNQ
jgi:5-methylcytosine-specific restriction endonuclease McrA